MSALPRRGDWIQTFTGLQFWPMDPRATEVRLEDIAHALSMMCRFNGHIRRFYSVAQHCVLLSHRVPIQDALWGLLHDGSEAYIADVSSPVKRLDAMAPYRDAERAIMAAICEHFGLPMVQPASVSEADLRMLATEKRDLLVNAGHGWRLNVEPYDDLTITSWAPGDAETAFLNRFSEIVRAQSARQSS